VNYHCCDIVRVNKFPANHINEFARVEEVGEDYVVVSNMNQPFQGTLANKKLALHEVSPHRCMEDRR
jgi:hypothetical protein